MDIKDIKKRLDEMGNKSDMDDMLRRLSLLEKDLKGKVDCDHFDTELNIIKEVLTHLE